MSLRIGVMKINLRNKEKHVMNVTDCDLEYHPKSDQLRGGDSLTQGTAGVYLGGLGLHTNVFLVACVGP